MRNVVSFVLVLTMSGLVFGFAGGDGSAASPYQVSTVADINAIDSEPEASYIMVNDIDLTGQNYTAAPIGAAWYDGTTLTGTAFNGTFDGNGHVISNLSIADTDTGRPTGLIGTAWTGTVIQNVGIAGANVSGANNAGALVGSSQGVVSNCYLSYTPGDPNNSVSGTICVGGLIGVSATTTQSVVGCWTETDVIGESQVGGLVGQSRGTIEDCYAMSRVRATAATDARAGGLIGLQFSGAVSDCHATGKVTSPGIRLGGLVGQLGYGTTTTQSIDNSYAAGDVRYTGITTGISYVGGLVGLAMGDVNECYATGDVDGGTGQRAAGLVSQASRTVLNSYATGNVSGASVVGGVVAITGDSPARVENCYATGTVTGASTVGGVVGYRYRGGVYACLWDTETSGTVVGVGAGGGDATGKTTAEMKTKSTFTDAGWDFDDVWVMLTKITPEFLGYPTLSWQVDLSECDFNKDGIVDVADFVVFSGEWLSEAY